MGYFDSTSFSWLLLLPGAGFNFFDRVLFVITHIQRKKVFCLFSFSCFFLFIFSIVSLVFFFSTVSSFYSSSSYSGSSAEASMLLVAGSYLPAQPADSPSSLRNHMLPSKSRRNFLPLKSHGCA